MGGLGSGIWFRLEKKSTVDESLTLAVSDFRDRIYPKSSGTFTWTWAGGNKSSIGYIVTWGDTPTITLHYRWRDSEDVRVLVHLQTTPTQFGGQRRWFTCPLVVNGVACGRRVGKLHLPPGARFFGCRTCHRLTYRSSQEAHQTERLFGRIKQMEQWVGTLKKREA
ncbi:MAG: hypothetical protein ABGZ35_00200 [Planctomycetaceae bacterium]